PLYDALGDPEETAVLGDLLTDAAEITGGTGVVRFYHEGGDRPSGRVRARGAEQSNSSIVFGDRQVLKVFRKLEAGQNPELKMLRCLQRHGFRNTAPPEAWPHYNGQLMDPTPGVPQKVAGRAAD